VNEGVDVILTQHYLACLSHASYLIGDETTGRAVIVDPRRDVGIYLEEAAERGLRIERVIETHVHDGGVAERRSRSRRALRVVAAAASAIWRICSTIANRALSSTSARPSSRRRAAAAFCSHALIGGRDRVR
jgi:hypothetical protein